jgi:hypothetical protein
MGKVHLKNESILLLSSTFLVSSLYFSIDTQYDVIREAAKDLGWKLSEDDSEPFDVYWSDLTVPNERL